MSKRKSIKPEAKAQPCVGCVIIEAVKAAFPDGPPQDDEQAFNFAMRLANASAGILASLDWSLDLMFMRRFTERLVEMRSGEATDSEDVAWPDKPFAPGLQ